MTKKNKPLSIGELEVFLKNIDFPLPAGFIDFFHQENGAEISRNSTYTVIWPLTDMIELNQRYNVYTYAPGFFVFGSDGGDIAYCICKTNGYIYEMSFVGMSNEDAVFKCKSLKELLE